MKSICRSCRFEDIPLKEYTDIQHTKLEDQPNKILQITNKSHHGFVNAFRMAYENSAPLELRPDVFILLFCNH